MAAGSWVYLALVGKGLKECAPGHNHNITGSGPGVKEFWYLYFQKS